MADNYIDLDAYLAEQDAKPIIVKVFGDEWHLPPSPPADTMLRVQRMISIMLDAQDRLRKLGPDADVPEDLLEALTFDQRQYAADLLGEETLDSLLKRGLNHDGLTHLLQQVLAIHQGGGAGGEQAPNRQARRKGGRSSSKTSSKTGA